MSARSSGSTPACAALAARQVMTNEPRRLRSLLFTRLPCLPGLITAATATGTAGGAARTFARLEHVIEEVLGDGRAREGHDGVGEVLAIVRSHPRFDGAAARHEQGRTDHKQTADGHGLRSYSFNIDRICVR